MTEVQTKRRNWEARFPGLDDEWSYWWIEGDGALLAILGGADLVAALDIVERHHGQCLSIVAHRAKVDSFGELVRDQKRRAEIASRKELPAGFVEGQGNV
jgi:hypothetical protein